MYKVFFQNNSLSFIDENQIQDTSGIYFFEGLAITDRDYILELLNIPVNGGAKFYLVGRKYDESMTDFFKDFEQIRAAGGIVECGDEVLIIRKNGKWDFPKGKCEMGESLKEAAVREVTEETGIQDLSTDEKARLQDTYHTYNTYGPNSIKKTSWFVMQTKEKIAGIPQTEEGITEVKWVPRSELSKYFTYSDSYASLRAVVEEYMNIKE